MSESEWISRWGRLIDVSAVTANIFRPQRGTSPAILFTPAKVGPWIPQVDLDRTDREQLETLRDAIYLLEIRASKDYSRGR